MARFRLLLLLTPLIVVFDQLTKLYIDRNYLLHQSLTVIENFFNITYVRNKGAAFGILSDSAIRIPFFIGITLVALVGILWYLSKLTATQKLLNLALSLIFAGALGNLIDRVRFGEVIDFLDVHWYRHHWPAFNVADSAICIGVGLLLLDLWFEEREKKRQHDTSGANS